MNISFKTLKNMAINNSSNNSSKKLSNKKVNKSSKEPRDVIEIFSKQYEGFFK